MVFNQELYDQVSNAWGQSLSAEAATPVYAGNLEDATYLKMLQTMRDFKPDQYVEEPTKEGE